MRSDGVVRSPGVCEAVEDLSDEPTSDLGSETAAPPCRARSPREASPESGSCGTSSMPACLGCSASRPFPSRLSCRMRASLGGEPVRRGREFFLWQPCDSRLLVLPPRLARLLTCEWPGRPDPELPGLSPFPFRPRGPRDACRCCCCCWCGCCCSCNSVCFLPSEPRHDPAEGLRLPQPGLPGAADKGTAAILPRPHASAQEHLVTRERMRRHARLPTGGRLLGFFLFASARTPLSSNVQPQAGLGP